MKTNNTQSLYSLLHWQGGTIHQIADLLDVPAETLLYGMPADTRGAATPLMLGQWAFSTCSNEYIKNTLLKAYRGNADFWIGYMRAATLKENSK